MKIPALALRLSLIMLLLIMVPPSVAQENKPPDYSSKPLGEWTKALKTSKNSQPYFHAMEALGPDGPYAKVAVPALIEAFKDKDWRIAGQPAETLASHGAAVVPNLIQALKRPESEIRTGVAEALGLVRPRAREAVPALIVAAKDSDSWVRGQALASLGVVGRSSPEAMKAVIAALQDQNEGTRRVAIGVLGDWGRRAKPAVPGLITTVKDKKTRHEAAEAFVKIGPEAKAAVEALREALLDETRPYTREKLIQALGAIGPDAREAIPDLEKLLHDPEGEVWQAAAYALGQMGTAAKSAVPELIALAKRGNGASIWALGQIGPDAKDAVPLLLEALQIKNPTHQQTYAFPPIAAALGGIGPEARVAVPRLAELATDRGIDRYVRQAMAEAIFKIDPEAAARLHMDTAYLNIRQGKIADIKPHSRAAITEEQKKDIRSLIKKLADIDRADFGVSATMTGYAFAPLPDQEHAGMMMITDHKLQRFDALRRLVEKGPDALPFLLEALDDKTPTKLTIVHGSGPIGFMGFADELGINPLNPDERRPRDQKPMEEPDDAEETGFLETYTVRVGDICFVALGQIVGRAYQAVRYQPTAIEIINSPVHSKEFRECIRAIWSSQDPTKKLFGSLLRDYATEAIAENGVLYGAHEATQRQADAAMRLLYYFPKESTPLIAERLKRLVVTKPKSEKREDRWQREQANGLYVEDFLKAVAWCKEPAIRSVILDIFRRTDDAKVMAAIVSSLKETEPEIILSRLRDLLKKLPATEKDSRGEGHEWLRLLAEYLGDTAKPEFERYLDKASEQRRWTVCSVLEETRPKWALEFLAPMLADRTGEGVRVCDKAAEVLSQIHPELKFDMEGTGEERDRQIEKIREQIASKKK
jgi:HEAT repeat protein